MTRHAKLLLGGVALAAVGLGAAGAIARHGHHGPGWGHHGGMGMGGPMMGRLCKGDRTAAEMADHMLVRIEHGVKPTDAQKAGFEELKTALRTAAEKVQASCPPKPAPAADGTPPPRPSPVERLARAETMTAATLEAIKTVRPAAEKFYASLSDEQKKVLEERRGGKHRWWKRHRGGDGDGPRGDGPGRGRDGDDGETLP
jgi:hypothetical protein